MEDLKESLIVNEDEEYDIEAAVDDSAENDSYIEYDPIANKKAWSKFRSKNIPQEPSQEPKRLKFDSELINKEFLPRVKLLRGQSVNDQIPEVKSLALCFAAFEGDLSWVQAIVGGELSFQATSCSFIIASVIEGIYATPVEFAARKGRVSIVKFLLDKHGSAFDADSIRRALLYVATYGCDDETASSIKSHNDDNLTNVNEESELNVETKSLEVIDAILTSGQPHGFTTVETLLKCEAAALGGIEGWNSFNGLKPKAYRAFLKRLKQFGDDCIDEVAWAQGIREAAQVGETQLIATQLRVHPNKLQFPNPNGVQLVWLDTLNIARDNGDTTLVDLLRRSDRLSSYESDLAARWAPGAWSLWAASSETRRIDMTERLSLLTDYPHTLPQAIKSWFQSLMYNNFAFWKADVYNTSSRIKELKKLLALDGGNEMSVSVPRAGSVLEGYLIPENEYYGNHQDTHFASTGGRSSAASSSFRRRMRGCHIDADLRPFYGDLHRRSASKPYTGIAVTALERAAEVGDDAVVRLLLLAGARTTGSACFVARYWNHRKVIALLSGPRAKAIKALTQPILSSSSLTTSPLRNNSRAASNASSGMQSSDGVALPTVLGSNQYRESNSNLSPILDNQLAVRNESQSISSHHQLPSRESSLSSTLGGSAFGGDHGSSAYVLSMLSDSPQVETLRIKEYQNRVGTSSFFYWRYVSRMDCWVIIFIVAVLIVLGGMGLVGIILSPDLVSGKSISL